MRTATAHGTASPVPRRRVDTAAGVDDDLDGVLPHVGEDARAWLRAALDLTRPAHPWSARLAWPASAADPGRA
jgi:hypothetical protein